MPYRRRRYGRRRAPRRRLAPRRRYQRRRYAPRVRRPVGNTVTLNRIRDKPITVCKTLFSAWTGVGTGTYVGAQFYFDPSNVGTSTPWTPGPIFTNTLMPQWSQYTALYDQYKVRWVKVTCCLDVSGFDGGWNALPTVECLMRYNYDSQLNVISSVMSQLPNVRMHRFTAETPYVTYKVYPRVNCTADVPGQVLAYESLYSKKQPWTDVDFPVALYGLAFYMFNLPSGCTMSIDITYNCSFRQSV